MLNRRYIQCLDQVIYVCGALYLPWAPTPALTAATTTSDLGRTGEMSYSFPHRLISFTTFAISVIPTLLPGRDAGLAGARRFVWFVEEFPKRLGLERIFRGYIIPGKSRQSLLPCIQDRTWIPPLLPMPAQNRLPVAVDIVCHKASSGETNCC